MAHTDKHASKHASGQEDDVNGQVDHGSIQGLADDDHSQYLKTDGSRAITGDQSAGGNKVTTVATPTADGDAATKGYVDGIAQGLAWQDPVIRKDLTAPPGGESVGDRYIPASVASGDWTGHENDIAECVSTGPTVWEYTTPTEGFCCRVTTDDNQVIYNGAAWVLFGTTVDHGNLNGLADDDHSQYHNNTRGDARYRTQAELSSVTPDSEGAALVGTDTKTNLGSATEVEAALTATNTHVGDATIHYEEGSIDHGSIAGLADDDHTQYLKADGTRALSGDQSAGGKKITNLAAPVGDNDAARKADVVAGDLSPPYVESITASEPALAAGERKIWKDTTLTKWYLVFGTDGTVGGNKKVEMT